MGRCWRDRWRQGSRRRAYTDVFTACLSSTCLWPDYQLSLMHNHYFFSMGSKVPPTLSHSALVIFRNPLPLHEFIPWQALVAVSQALWPLQALAPRHLPWASPAMVATGAPASMAAAAAASASPCTFSAVDFIVHPPVDCSGNGMQVRHEGA